jgi:hypothetical protein
MAGFILNQGAGELEFHIGSPEDVERIKEAVSNKRVVTFQVDGDELDAVIWGITNYGKGT